MLSAARRRAGWRATKTPALPGVLAGWQAPASAGKDHTIRIWDVASRKPLLPFAEEPGEALYVCALGTGKKVGIQHKFASRRSSSIALFGNEFLVWFVAGTGEWRGPAAAGSRTEGEQDFCFSPDGKVLARREAGRGWSGWMMLRREGASPAREGR